jgi:hypothetical protein
MSFKDVRAIVQAVSLYALVWGVIGFMAAVEGIPRSVIFQQAYIQRYVQVLMTAEYLHCLLHKSTPAFGHY